ncbi:S-adenosyl methyltransferase [Streptomyces sp. WMMB 714]|uniref:SAM-dependent methyltransferase n=1 Tax=Streptomyces sp. WMMB 714 TaxID=1286822 RepID=UPI0006970ACB|nr:SAM-dependent methyltransferase [Streptomyces sp. WMMB 714]SCK46027.1 S-adenosyl methyltransferase [Streptomyces sp. WMMB 714]
MLEPYEVKAALGLREITTPSRGAEIRETQLCGDSWTAPAEPLENTLLVVPDGARWPLHDPCARLRELASRQTAGVVAVPQHAGRLADAAARCGAPPILAPSGRHIGAAELKSRLDRRLSDAARLHQAQRRAVSRRAALLHTQERGPGGLLDLLEEQTAARVVLLEQDPRTRTWDVHRQDRAHPALTPDEQRTLDAESEFLSRLTGRSATAKFTTARHAALAYRIESGSPRAQVLLALRTSPWPRRVTRLLEQAVEKAEFLMQRQDLLASQYAVRAQVLRHLLDGKTALAARDASSLGLPDLCGSPAVQVCVVEAAPGEPLAPLSAAVQDALRGDCLTVVDPDDERRLIVLRQAWSPDADEGAAAEQLQPLVASVAGRATGVSRPVPWPATRKGVDQASGALLTARARLDRVAVGRLGASIADALPSGAEHWSRVLLRPLSAKYDGPELTGRLEQCLTTLTTPSSRSDPHRRTARRRLREAAETVGLVRPDEPLTLAASAVLYLAIRIRAQCPPTAVEGEVPPLRSLLTAREGRAHAERLFRGLPLAARGFLRTWLLQHQAHQGRTAEALGVGRNRIPERIKKLAAELPPRSLTLSQPGSFRFELYLALLAAGEHAPLPDPVAQQVPAAAEADRPGQPDEPAVPGRGRPAPSRPRPRHDQAALTRPRYPLPVSADGHRLKRVSVANVYDELLGGDAVYPEDSEVARRIERVFPARPCAVGVQRFLGRALRALVDEGVEQFLDVGPGNPTDPGGHVTAQSLVPHARYVAVDNDEQVVAHWRNALRDEPGTPEGRAACMTGDATRPGELLALPGLFTTEDVPGVLDPDRPVGLLLGALPSFLGGGRTRGIVRRLMQPLAPGSCVVIAHATADFTGDTMPESARIWADSGVTVNFTGRDGVAQLVAGLDVLDPGIVAAPRWRPLPDAPVPLDSEVGMYAVVARKRRTCLDGRAPTRTCAR